MNVNSGINQYNAYMSNGVAASVSSAQSLTGSALSQLQEGQVFEGIVSGVENGKVSLLLANGQTISARLEASVLLQEGQSLFFQVKSNDGSLIQIRPVSINNPSFNPTLINALESAGVSVSERSLAMVNSMMKEAMPIDADSLASINRLLLANPSIDPATLTQLVKYDFPVTIENANMFNAYATDSSSIKDSFINIAEGLCQLLASDDIGEGQAILLNNSISELINNKSSHLIESQTNFHIGSNKVDADINTTIKPVAELSTNTDIPSSVKTVSDEVPATDSSAGDILLKNILTPKQATGYAALLDALEGFDSKNSRLFDESGNFLKSATASDLYRTLTDYLNANPLIDKDSLKDIFTSSSYKKLLTSLLLDNISLSPEALKEEGQINRLYNKVLEQTEAFHNILKDINNSAANSVNNQLQLVKDNIYFMESANQLYSFVQLPLKMFNQHSQGSLYVRQNKKNSYQAGEEITAFLHFDMEYLGSTDVYIKMQNTVVDCNWNLSNESSFRLIENNMDILNERLATKGYLLSSHVECTDKKLSFTKDFLQTNSFDKDKVGLMHRYSFDMRA